MSRYWDIHNHSEYSLYDGFGKSYERAKQAKELGYVALGISDHGTTAGLIKHHGSCLEEEIKPVLGVEAYFLPKIKEQTRGFHLCLFAKNAKGYGNINRMQYYGDLQKYYNPIVTFKELEKYNEGVICTSACIGSFFGKMIMEGKEKLAYKALKRFKQIFGEDFYVEIQPYKVDEERTQEYVNDMIFRMAKKLDIKCILSSDAHRAKEEDWETYLKLHEMSGRLEDSIRDTYYERFFPSEKQICNRFLKMHGSKNCKYPFKNPKKELDKMLDNLQEIADKVDEDIISQLPENVPQYKTKKDSFEVLKKLAIKGLKQKGLWDNKEYRQRAKEELSVIKYHNIQNYFLMVRDYAVYAKNRDIAIGPGRGSACNCLIAYVTDITDTDPVLFELDYHRFIRKDKKKMPKAINFPGYKLKNINILGM